MSNATKRARDSPLGSSSADQFYDYAFLRPGRQVKRHELALFEFAMPTLRHGAIGQAFLAFVPSTQPRNAFDTLAERLGDGSEQVMPAPREESLESVGHGLSQLVDELLDVWYSVGAHQSSIRRASKHPSFELLRKAPTLAVERIVPRMRASPNPLWIWALGELSGEDPARGVDSNQEAARAWLAWADERGLD